MKFYTLMSDKVNKGNSFLTEHGLSLYFEHSGEGFLFDTGETDAFIYNATLLGIDLTKVSACIISHAHIGHTGGLSHFLNINKKATVYLKTAATGEFYSQYSRRKERTGLDPEFVRQYAGRLHFFDDQITIAEGVTAASVRVFRRLPQHTSLLLEKRGEKFVKDPLEHELYLSVQTGSGTVVLIGCAHRGAINTLMSAQEDFGPLHAVIGGFHLNGLGRRNARREPEFEVNALARYLTDNKIKHVYAGHCTGEKQLEKLGLLARVNRLYAGRVIEV